MHYEEFERLSENGYFRPGERLWIYEFHFGNVEGRISRHTAPTEVEIDEYRQFRKVSAKTGRTLHTRVYAYQEAYQEGEWPNSRYVMQVFEHKEDCLESYRSSVDFWKERVEDRRKRLNDHLDAQLTYMQEYADKVE